MVKNRYFKDTLGNFSELAIVTQVDASGSTSATQQPSVATVSVTVSGSPTAGHVLTLTFSNGLVVNYTAPATPTTAILNAGIVAAIEALLPAGSSVTSTGTTTQVITIGVPGASYNAVTITTTASGASWTPGSVATFAGGVNADATAADSYKLFAANALAGSIWAFWYDTNLALAPGDTANALNAGRKYYYAWKQNDGVMIHRTSPITVTGKTVTTQAYQAGTPQIMTLTSTGTFSLGQIVHVRIIDMTPTQLPYASYDYVATIGASGINQAMTDLATAINAEKTDPIVTATASTNVLTITGIKNYVIFKIAAFNEVTTAQPSDLSVFTFATTQKALMTIGDINYVKELELYYNNNAGGINYAPEGTRPIEFGDILSNIGTNSVTQFGLLLVTDEKLEKGVTRQYNHTQKILIAIKNTDLATLAAL